MCYSILEVEYQEAEPSARGDCVVEVRVVGGGIVLGHVRLGIGNAAVLMIQATAQSSSTRFGCYVSITMSATPPCEGPWWTIHLVLLCDRNLQ